jgi:hypothetical protein
MILDTVKPADSGLADRLREAARRGVSAEDLHAQRVSFIVSSVSDEKTKVTSEQVEKELSRLHGTVR